MKTKSKEAAKSVHARHNDLYVLYTEDGGRDGEKERKRIQLYGEMK